MLQALDRLVQALHPQRLSGVANIRCEGFHTLQMHCELDNITPPPCQALLAKMQSVSSLRTSAFCGSTVHPAAARASGVASRAPVMVRAVQNLQGTVVSTAMNKTVVVAVERLAPHDKVRGTAAQKQRE